MENGHAKPIHALISGFKTFNNYIISSYYHLSDTEIGSSLFKVFLGPADWDTAKANCESTKVKAKMMGITMTAKGHLANDKDDEIHAYLKNKHETMSGLSGDKLLLA